MVQSTMEVHHALLNLELLLVYEVVDLKQIIARIPSKAEVRDIECLHGLQLMSNVYLRCLPWVLLDLSHPFFTLFKEVLFEAL